MQPLERGPCRGARAPRVSGAGSGRRARRGQDRGGRVPDVVTQGECRASFANGDYSQGSTGVHSDWYHDGGKMDGPV